VKIREIGGYQLRGRKPNPIRIQLAAGDPRRKGWRKLREEASLELKVQSGLPDVPVDATPEVQSEYLRIKQLLEDSGLAHQPDQICVHLAAIACIEAKKRRSGESLRTALAYLSNLGLGGEVSRMRIKNDKSDTTEQDLMALLSTPRERNKNVLNSEQSKGESPAN
jgi:hypothetical protein